MIREALAERAALTGPTITGVEDGLRTEPRWQTLRNLASALEVEVPELIRLAIEMAPGEGGDVLRERERKALDAEKDKAG